MYWNKISDFTRSLIQQMARCIARDIFWKDSDLLISLYITSSAIIHRLGTLSNLANIVHCSYKYFEAIKNV